MINLIIAGSRDFDLSYRFFKREVDNFIVSHLEVSTNDITILSGNARGVDRMGEEYAKDNKIDLIIIPANWGKYGKQAGYLRNKRMAEMANAAIIFWNGESRGTENMIDIAKQFKLRTKVIQYDLDDYDDDDFTIMPWDIIG